MIAHSRGALINPETNVAAPNQTTVIIRPVHDPVLGSGDMVATRCVELERHDKLSKTEAEPDILIIRSEPDILIIRSMHQSPSEPFSKTPTASWSRPRFNKHGEMRSRSQPRILKVWFSNIEACPSPKLLANLCRPLETRRAFAAAPTAAATLLAVVPTSCSHRCEGTDLVLSSPAGRNPDPFPHSMLFRPAIDRGPRCF